jgi:NMD protein affecting ribosome stability and mRNA decay
MKPPLLLLRAIVALLECRHSQSQAMRLGTGATWLRCRNCGSWKRPTGEWERPTLVEALGQD